jgi:hypothetical protein
MFREGSSSRCRRSPSCWRWAAGAVALGVVSTGAATAALGVAAVAGTGYFLYDVGKQYLNGNSAGLAYDAGSFLGGMAGGPAGARMTYTGVNQAAWPGWSAIANEPNQLYQRGLGSFKDWFGTGPTVGSAAGAPGADGPAAGTIKKGGC